MEPQAHLVPGATVYGADGNKVGTVRTYGGNYMVVEKGFFFPTDYYIPMSAVETYTEEEVYLTVSKDEALNQGWDTEPVQGPAAEINPEDQQSGYSAGGFQQNAYELDHPETGAYQTDTPGAMASQEDGTTVDNYAAGTTSDAARVERTRGESTFRVPVHEEQIEATKRTVSAGDVRITKNVVTDQETIEVPVTEERIRVHWRTPTREVAADEAVFEEGSIEVPVSREVVDVNKRTVRTGELEVTKELEEHTEQVSESVRREVVDVDESRVQSNTGKSKTRK